MPDDAENLPLEDQEDQPDEMPQNMLNLTAWPIKRPSPSTFLVTFNNNKRSSLAILRARIARFKRDRNAQQCCVCRSSERVLLAHQLDHIISFFVGLRYALRTIRLFLFFLFASIVGAARARSRLLSGRLDC